MAREVVFLARPTHRVVRVKATAHAEAAERFTRGEATYDAVLRTLTREGGEVELTDPRRRPPPVSLLRGRPREDGPLLDGEAPARGQRLRRTRWSASASSFPQLVITSSALRAGYARLVEGEVFRVIEGRSKPQPTSDEPIAIDVGAYPAGRARAGRRRARPQRRRAQGIPRVLPVRLHHREERRQVLPDPAHGRMRSSRSGRPRPAGRSPGSAWSSRTRACRRPTRS